MAIGLIIIRKRPGINPGFKVKGNKVIPLLFSLFSFIIVINQILLEPKDSISGLLLVLAGIPVYYIWLKIQTLKNRDNANY
jgi:APA family basic amino acid/polyamine antiporter